MLGRISGRYVINILTFEVDVYLHNLIISGIKYIYITFAIYQQKNTILL